MKNKVSSKESNRKSSDDFNMIPVKYQQNAGTKKRELKSNKLENPISFKNLKIVYKIIFSFK